jgi:hypothetical protein
MECFEIVKNILQVGSENANLAKSGQQESGSFFLIPRNVIRKNARVQESKEGLSTRHRHRHRQLH